MTESEKSNLNKGGLIGAFGGAGSLGPADGGVLEPRLPLWRRWPMGSVGVSTSRLPFPGHGSNVPLVPAGSHNARCRYFSYSDCAAHTPKLERNAQLDLSSLFKHFATRIKSIQKVSEKTRPNSSAAFRGPVTRSSIRISITLLHLVATHQPISIFRRLAAQLTTLKAVKGATWINA